MLIAYYPFAGFSKPLFSDLAIHLFMSPILNKAKEIADHIKKQKNILIITHIDADGIAKVSARDVTTGREQSVEVRPTSGLTPEEVHSIIKRTRGEESELKTKER